MYIKFRDRKLERALEDARKLTALFGEQMARKLVQRLEQIRAADSLGMMVEQKIGRCHPLTGNRRGQFALDLVHPARLIIEPVIEGKTEKHEWQTVRIICVLEVTDYHG